MTSPIAAATEAAYRIVMPGDRANQIIQSYVTWINGKDDVQQAAAALEAASNGPTNPERVIQRAETLYTAMTTEGGSGGFKDWGAQVWGRWTFEDYGTPEPVDPVNGLVLGPGFRDIGFTTFNEMSEQFWVGADDAALGLMVPHSGFYEVRWDAEFTASFKFTSRIEGPSQLWHASYYDRTASAAQFVPATNYYSYISKGDVLTLVIGDQDGTVNTSVPSSQLTISALATFD